MCWSNDVLREDIGRYNVRRELKEGRVGRKRALCRIDLWQSEVDERLHDPVGAYGERDADRLSYLCSATQAYDRQVSSTSLELDAHFETITWLSGDQRTGPGTR